VLPKEASIPPAVVAVFAIIWFLLMGGMVVAYIIMLIAGWRLMKAHEKIASKLSEIADKLQLK
jgi:phage shock protein PspC (stress-responsive transcriptional regulator)